MAARFIAAAYADECGLKRVFVSEWIARILATFSFLVSSSPAGFAVANAFEGLSDGLFWAVSRTALFAQTRGKEGATSAFFYAFRNLLIAMGMLAAGWAASSFTFEQILGFLVLAVFISGVFPASYPPDTVPRASPRAIMRKLSPAGRTRAFWLVSLGAVFYSYAIASIATFAPIIMRTQFGFDYWLIGLITAGYSIVYAIAALCGQRLHLAKRAETAIQISLFTLAAIGIYLIPSPLAFSALFLAIATADAFHTLVFEDAMAKVAKKGRVSINVALIVTPSNIASAASIAISGFIAQYAGFGPVFLISAVAFAAHAIINYRVLGPDGRRG